MPLPNLNLEKPQTELTLPSGFLTHGKPPVRIQDRVKLELTPHTYLPKTIDPREDWVSSVAVPAFDAFNTKYPGRAQSFATIGTGPGQDALAAIEILNPKTVMVTDLHQDVVDAAVRNLNHNLATGHKVELLDDVGELGDPLVKSGIKYDLVYENLPNIPLPDDKLLGDNINSSSFVPRDLNAGSTASQYLLELHSKLISHANKFLNPDGHVLSSIGARVPLHSLIEMAKEAGSKAEILTYTWKIQSEAEEVIRGYADWEAKGKGPFYFYPVERVREVFSRYETPADAAKHAIDIEKELEKDRISATDALVMVKRKIPLAHTVAVIDSQPEQRGDRS